MNTEDRIQELEAKVAQLMGIIEHTKAAESGPVAVATPDASTTAVNGPVRGSRRNLLKLAGAAAAAGAVAATATGALPAAADDPNDLTMSSVKSTSSASRDVTGFVYTSAQSPQAPGFLFSSTVNANAFLVRDNPGGIFIIGGQNGSSYPAAVAGYANSVLTHGIYGQSNVANGYGAVGFGTANTSVGVLARGAKANIELYADGTAPPTRTDAHLKGEMVCDTNGDLWVCIVAGTPGTWRHLAGASTSGSLHLITPKRVYDSRPAEEPLPIGPKTSLAASTRTVDCTLNSSGVPATATGLLLNVTAITVSASGYLAVTPGGAGFTGTSTLNWATAGVAVANSVTVAAGAGAKIDLTTGGGGNADVIVDVFGYYS